MAKQKRQTVKIVNPAPGCACYTSARRAHRMVVNGFARVTADGALELIERRPKVDDKQHSWRGCLPPSKVIYPPNTAPVIPATDRAGAWMRAQWR